MTPETEVFKFLSKFLKNTPWYNLTFAVGGYVRDELLSLIPKDLDILVTKDKGAEELTSFIQSSFPNSISFPRNMGVYPIWQITFKTNIIHNEELFETAGAIIEFADTMSETFPDTTSRQREVRFATLEEDILRRDFTINAILKNLKGEYVDYCGGIDDLENKLIRTNRNVNPEEIFSVDPLRILRLARFIVKYGFNYTGRDCEAIFKVKDRLSIVSKERILDEITKVCNIGKFAEFMNLMNEWSTLHLICPEMIPMIGCTQPVQFHSEGDVWEHSLLVTKNSKPTLNNQLFGMFHDIGKPSKKVVEGDKLSFVGHDLASVDIAAKVFDNWKLPNENKEKILKAIFHHMRLNNLTGSEVKALRKVIREFGDDLDFFLDCCESDCLGSLPVRNNIPDIRAGINIILNSKVPVSRKAILNGTEIMDALGIAPGPKVGEITKILLDWEDSKVSEGIEVSKESAINFIKNI